MHDCTQHSEEFHVCLVYCILCFVAAGALYTEPEHPAGLGQTTSVQGAAVTKWSMNCPIAAEVDVCSGTTICAAYLARRSSTMAHDISRQACKLSLSLLKAEQLQLPWGKKHARQVKKRLTDMLFNPR